jgi:DNA-binding transcriptional MerR regulator
VPRRLVPTGVAAREIGVDRGTLVRWWQRGLVEPAMVTPGGHARWDVDELLRQLRAQRQRDT